MDGDVRVLGRGSSLKIVGAATNMVLTFVLVLVVTRGYGKEVAGVFFAATTLFLLIGQSAEIGTDESLVKFITAFRASNRRGDVAKLVRRAFKPVLLAGGAAAVATLVLAPALARALSNRDQIQQVTVLLRWLVLFIPLVAITEVALAATRGYHVMGPSVVVHDVLIPGGQALFAITARLLAAGNVIALTMTFAVPYLLAAGWAAASLRRRLLLDGAFPETGGELTRGYWRFTAPRAAARICQATLRRVDILLVAAIAGPRDAAVYTALTRFIAVGSFGVGAVQQVAQPKLGELLHIKDRARSLEVFRTTTVWLVSVTWPIYTIIAIFSPALLSVFGRGYRVGAAALTILCVSELVTDGTGPVDIALVMSGRSALSSSLYALSLLIDVALCLLFIPRYGVAGAALAKAIALVANNAIEAVIAFSSLGLHPFSRGFAVLAGGAIVGVGGVGFATRAILGSTPAALLAASAVSGLGYGALLFYQRRPLRLDALVSGALKR